MNQEIINTQLWKICTSFKEKTDIKKNYIIYISALLYLRYYKSFYYNDFDELYNRKNDYYIDDDIDSKIKNIQNYDKYLFSNIHFKSIVTYRDLGETNILTQIITDIKNLTDKTSKQAIAEAYEYVLKQAIVKNDILKQNGEFYTPLEITNLMANLIIEEDNKTIYDPVCGSGNFIKSAMNKCKGEVFGEEKNLDYYNICKTRLLLNDIKDENIIYEKENKLLQNIKFDYILSNPPFSEKNWIEKIYDSKDYEIFNSYKLKPSSVGDYAYVIKMLSRLKCDGKMAVILPHGVLFRENEKEVRKRLIQENYIEAIIGLPDNLFYTTRMSVIILIISKNKKNENIFIIDASEDYSNDKKNKVLSPKYQDRIIEVYKNKTEIKDYSRIISTKDVINNDFNLTIKKYINKDDKRNSIENKDIIQHLIKLEKERKILEDNIKNVLEVLGYKEIVDLQQITKENNNYDVDYKVIGSNIKKARIKNKLTQEEVAEKLCLSVKYISRIENGTGGLRLESLVKFSKVLGVSLGEILGSN